MIHLHENNKAKHIIYTIHVKTTIQKTNTCMDHIHSKYTYQILYVWQSISIKICDYSTLSQTYGKCLLMKVATSLIILPSALKR